MISNIASDIVERLMKYQIIENNQSPVYQYGFEILLSSILTLIITIACGIVMGCVVPSIVFLIIFSSLRSLCGGYHADTYFKCNLIFMATNIIVLLFFRFVTVEDFIGLHYISIFLSVIVFAAYSPIVNENKPLNEKQKIKFRFLSMIMVISLCVISCLLEILLKNPYSILIDMTILIISVSMFVTDPMRGGEQR